MEVRLATGTGKGGRDESALAIRIGELEDQHVLGQPALVSGHGRGDPKGEALLAQEGVTPVARAVGPDLLGFWEVHDVLALGIAGPGNIDLGRMERATH